MAEKQVVSGKLQLTVSYTDENNKKKTVNFPSPK